MVSFVERVDNFLAKRPRLKKVLYFLKHPTTLRIMAVGAGVVTAILSGGATIPVIALVGVFATSCFSIVMETIQVRRKNNLLLQKAMLDGLVARKKALALKHGAKFLDLDRALLKTDAKHVQPKIDPPSKTRTLLATIGAVGLENAFPIAIAAASMNAPGALAYTAGLLLAIGRPIVYTGLAAYTVKGDFDARLALERAKAELKQDIAGLARDVRVPPFKSTAELSKLVAEKMREMDAVASVCEAKIPEGGERKAFEEALAALPMVETSVPKRSSFLDALWEGLNPFTTEDKLRVDHDPYAGVRDRIAHVHGAPVTRPKPVRSKAPPSPMHTPPITHEPPGRGTGKF